MLSQIEKTVIKDLKALGKIIEDDKAKEGATEHSSRVEIAILGAQMALKIQTLENISEEFFVAFAKATQSDLRFLFIGAMVMSTRKLIED